MRPNTSNGHRRATSPPFPRAEALSGGNPAGELKVVAHPLKGVDMNSVDLTAFNPLLSLLGGPSPTSEACSAAPPPSADSGGLGRNPWGHRLTPAGASLPNPFTTRDSHVRDCPAFHYPLMHPYDAIACSTPRCYPCLTRRSQVLRGGRRIGD